MITLLTLAISTVGTLISFAVILTQFIGTEVQNLEKLAIAQVLSLVIAMIFAFFVYLRLKKRVGKNYNLIKQLFTSMPGWLMFILLLLMVTTLLGDLAVFLVRLSGHQLSNLFHLPSICIVIFCMIYALIYHDFVVSRQNVSSDEISD